MVTDKMQQTLTVETPSGHAALFDPAGLGAATREPADFESLERGARDGTILSFAARDETTVVRIVVDEELPATDQVIAAESRMTLRVPSGQLRAVDAGGIQEAVVIGGPSAAATAVAGCLPGDREGPRLAAPEVKADLRSAAGAVPVGFRNWLSTGTLLLAALTVIGFPVFLVGRGLDDGLVGVAGALGSGLLVLVPIWAVVVLLWRLPILRRVTRAAQPVAMAHPDALVVLERSGG